MAILSLTTFCSNAIAFSQVGKALLCCRTSFRANKKDDLAPVSPGYLNGSMSTIDVRNCTFHFCHSARSIAGVAWAATVPITVPVPVPAKLMTAR